MNFELVLLEEETKRAKRSKNGKRRDGMIEKDEIFQLCDHIYGWDNENRIVKVWRRKGIS
jgi:hypothetical protein